MKGIKGLKEARNTWDDVIFTPARRSGNTIRQIDKAIQLLYDGYIVKVVDHWEYGRHYNANRHLFDGILRRLQCEHRLQELTRKKEIRINRNKLELELLNL